MAGLPDGIPFSFPLHTVDEVDQLEVYLKENSDHGVALVCILMLSENISSNNVIFVSVSLFVWFRWESCAWKN